MSEPKAVQAPVRRWRRARMLMPVLVGIVVVGGALMYAGWKWHEQPQFCGICHIMKPYVASWESSGLLANAHAQEGVSCLDCHEPTLGQQLQEVVKYVTGDYEQPLARSDYPMEQCFSCHEHASYEDIAARTADLGMTDPKTSEASPNPHLSMYPGLECETCHHNHQPSELYCDTAGCHSFGQQVP